MVHSYFADFNVVLTSSKVENIQTTLLNHSKEQKVQVHNRTVQESFEFHDVYVQKGEGNLKLKIYVGKLVHFQKN